jgi:hypothetical protein
MFNEFDIPFEWGQQSSNYITYHGDIYPGNIRFCPNYEEGFFIIPNINLKTLNALEQNKRTPDEYRNLGWEIKDRKIIPYDPIPSIQNFGASDNAPSQSRNGDEKWKRMFVFGAGASAFCSFGENTPRFLQSHLKPPIGTDIFNARYDSFIEQFSGVEEIIPFFEDKGWDIEACMQEEWAKAMNSFNPKITSRHINIQFYLSDLFRKISSEIFTKHKRGNLYSLFSLKLQAHLSKPKNSKEKIGIVSFNYDTILDQFIEINFNKPYSDMNDYIDWNNRQIVLFKPHGSSNWGWEFLPGQFDASTQSKIAQHLYSTQTLPAEIYYKMLGDLTSNVYQGAWAQEKIAHPRGIGRFTINKNRIKTFQSSQSNFFPALLMPYRDKDEFVMPYFHFNALRTYLGHIEELYLIGWKGSEDAFNLQINQRARNLKKIIIVNPDSNLVKENLSKVIKTDKFEFEVVDTFEEFVRNRMDTMIT